MEWYAIGVLATIVVAELIVISQTVARLGRMEQTLWTLEALVTRMKLRLPSDIDIGDEGQIEPASPSGNVTVGIPGQPAPQAPPSDSPQPKPVRFVSPGPSDSNQPAHAARLQPQLSPLPRPGPVLNIEQIVGGKLLLWVGAVAMFLAGIFLVNYWIDQGYITPAIRMGMAAALGAGLYALSWPLAKNGSTNLPDILAGIGVAILYAVILGSLYYYKWLNVDLTFALLIVANALLFVKASQSAATLGHFGTVLSYVTPLLVQMPDNDNLVLDGYLLLLSVTLCVLGIKTKRRRYVDFAVCWQTIWSAALLIGNSDNSHLEAASYWVLFMAIAGAWLSYDKTRLAERDGHVDRFNTLAVIVLLGAWLFGAETGYELPFWLAQVVVLASFSVVGQWRQLHRPLLMGVIVTFAVGIVAGAFARPELYAIAAALLLACATASSALATTAPAKQQAHIGAFATGAATILIWLASFWHTAQFTAVHTPLLLLIPAQVLCSAVAGWQTAKFAKDNGDDAYVYWSSVLCLCVGCGLGTALPYYYWPVALSATAALTVAMHKRHQSTVHYKQLLACTITTFALGVILACHDAITPQRGQLHLLIAPLVWMGLPAAVLFALSKCLKSEPDFSGYKDKIYSALMLLGLSGAFWQAHVLLSYVLGSNSDANTTYHVGALVTVVLAYAWLMFRLQPVDGDFAVLRTTTRFIGIAIVGFACLFCVLTFNPWLFPVAVGQTPFFNALWVLYGLPGLFIVLLSYPLAPDDTARQGTFMRATGLLFGLLFVLSLVRQYFHGSMFYGATAGSKEIYVYSLGMGLYGAALLWAGIARHEKLPRLVALLVLTITSIKVFVWDLSQLTGAYRFMSFFALGATLLAIGYVYQRTNLGDGRAGDKDDTPS